MSQENVEIVRRLYDEWSRGEYSRTDWAHPEIEFVMADTPEASTTTGIDGMVRTWQRFLDAWEGFHGQATEFIDVGDRVLVPTEFGGRGHESGVSIEGMPGSALFTFREGKVVRLDLFGNRERGFQAAGLSE